MAACNTILLHYKVILNVCFVWLVEEVAGETYSSWTTKSLITTLENHRLDASGVYYALEAMKHRSPKEARDIFKEYDMTPSRVDNALRELDIGLFEAYYRLKQYVGEVADDTSDDPVFKDLTPFEAMRAMQMLKYTPGEIDNEMWKLLDEGPEPTKAAFTAINLYKVIETFFDNDKSYLNWKNEHPAAFNALKKIYNSNERWKPHPSVTYFTTRSPLRDLKLPKHIGEVAILHNDPNPDNIKESDEDIGLGRYSYPVKSTVACCQGSHHNAPHVPPQPNPVNPVPPQPNPVHPVPPQQNSANPVPPQPNPVYPVPPQQNPVDPVPSKPDTVYPVPPQPNPVYPVPPQPNPVYPVPPQPTPINPVPPQPIPEYPVDTPGTNYQSTSIFPPTIPPVFSGTMKSNELPPGLRVVEPEPEPTPPQLAQDHYDLRDTQYDNRDRYEPLHDVMHVYNKMKDDAEDTPFQTVHQIRRWYDKKDDMVVESKRIIEHHQLNNGSYRKVNREVNRYNPREEPGKTYMKTKAPFRRQK